jgi:hypothetical protein
MRITSLSDLTGVEILVRSFCPVSPRQHADLNTSQGKCEFLNPFGSVKDRVSLRSEVPSRFNCLPVSPDLMFVPLSHQGSRG